MEDEVQSDSKEEKSMESKKEIVEDIEKSGVSEEVAEKEEALDEKEQERKLEDNQEINHESEEESKREEHKIIPENKESKALIVSEDKMGKIKSFLRGKNKDGSWKPMIFAMIASLAIALFWEKLPWIKDSVHAVLDPSAGALLQLNIPYGLEIGMIILIVIISLFTTLVQKYCTDQETIKELRKEQKLLQEKSKEFKSHPEKMMEIQKEMMPLTMKTMKLSMRAVMFTGIPFILFFRWFNDFFSTMGDPKFFGILSWFWFYLIAVMIFSSVFRKLLKVV